MHISIGNDHAGPALKKEIFSILFVITGLATSVYIESQSIFFIHFISIWGVFFVFQIDEQKAKKSGFK